MSDLPTSRIPPYLRHHALIVPLVAMLLSVFFSLGLLYISTSEIYSVREYRLPEAACAGERSLRVYVDREFYPPPLTGDWKMDVYSSWISGGVIYPGYEIYDIPVREGRYSGYSFIARYAPKDPGRYRLRTIFVFEGRFFGFPYTREYKVFSDNLMDVMVCRRGD